MIQVKELYKEYREEAKRKLEENGLRTLKVAVKAQIDHLFVQIEQHGDLSDERDVGIFIRLKAFQDVVTYEENKPQGFSRR